MLFTYLMKWLRSKIDYLKWFLLSIWRENWNVKLHSCSVGDKNIHSQQHHQQQIFKDPWCLKIFFSKLRKMFANNFSIKTVIDCILSTWWHKKLSHSESLLSMYEIHSCTGSKENWSIFLLLGWQYFLSYSDSRTGNIYQKTK